jgi:hypothetical protein
METRMHACTPWNVVEMWSRTVVHRGEKDGQAGMEKRYTNEPDEPDGMESAAHG